MNAQAPERAGQSSAGSAPEPAANGWLARIIAGRIEHVLSRIDRGLQAGALLVHLPEGESRLLGGRGDGPSAELTIHDWRAIRRFATGGSAGFYQAFEAHEWDSPDPAALFALVMRNAVHLGDTMRAKGPWRVAAKLYHWWHRNSRQGAQHNIAAHYDLGNDFYALWLDPTMSYSGARWEGIADDAPLEQAQRNKVALLTERLALVPGSRVLEIGCGWGFLARQLATGHAAEVTAISLSRQQVEWAHARQAIDPVPGTAFKFQDYRDVEGQFDAVISAEMVEAVGRAYWPSYLDCLARALPPGGRAAIQFIAIREELFGAYARSADFIQTYIFPGGMLLSTREFRRLAEARGFDWCDQADFGADYARTLRCWRRAFDAAVEAGRLPAGFDARFVRLWRFYLMYCEGGFAGGGITASQVTLIKRK